jgi:transposase-like protein
MAQQLLLEGNSISDIARLVGCSRPTVYRWLAGQEATVHFGRLAELTRTSLPNNRDVIDALTGKRMAPDD